MHLQPGQTTRSSFECINGGQSDPATLLSRTGGGRCKLRSAAPPYNAWLQLISMLDETTRCCAWA
jgi:hypothetical protein